MTTRLIIIRHGETEENVKRIYQDSGPGMGLTEKGKKQAEAIALKLKNVKVDAIYSSPARRTVQTAEAINKYHDLKINLESDLREFNYGVIKGKAEDSLTPQERNIVRSILFDESLRIPEGESYRDVRTRIRKAIDNIIKLHKDQTVVIVSHSKTIRTMVAEIMGLTISNVKSMNKSINTGYTEIEIDGKPKLIKLFESEHLSDL